MAVTVQEAQVVFSAEGMGKVSSAAAKASKAMDGMTGAARKAGGALAGIGSAFTGLKGAFAGVAIGAMATKVISLAAAAEQTGMEFEVLLGSAAKADTMLSQLREIDLKTVFGTQDLAKTASTMMRMGVEGDQVVAMMGMMTEVAGGSIEKLDSLAYALSQVEMAGRLTGQENLQLINAGFSPLAVMAELTGRSIQDLKKDMEAGAISADMVKQALSDLTTGSGRLAGFNAKIAESTAGMFSKAQSSLEMLAIELGGKVLPYANQFLEWAIQAIQSADGLGASFGVAVDSVASWFTQTQDYLTDAGVVLGSLAGDMDNVWAALFEEIPKYGQAAFEWISSNSKIAMENIATAASNMWSKMDQKSRQLGENIAFQLGISDEVLTIPEPTMQAFQEFQGFTAPPAGIAVQSLLDNATAQLAAVRAAREAERMTPEEKKAPGEGFAPVDFMGGASGGNQIAAAAGQAAMQAQTVERGSASSMFQKLQDKLAGNAEGLKIAKEQKDLQQKSLDVAQQMLGAITGGLPMVPILG
jgi:tape measure domain-containing protein